MMNFKIDTSKETDKSKMSFTFPSVMVYEGSFDEIIAIFEIEIFRGTITVEKGHHIFEFNCEDADRVDQLRKAILSVALKKFNENAN